jgi:iron complex transport system ATP-binding protein
MNSLPPPGSLLVLEGVSFSYRRRGRPDREVLRGVGLAVEAGELVVLLGPNGSGKTTLLQVALGRLAPQVGEVRLEGRPVGEWSRREVAQRIAVLPQLAALPEGFRVEELVEMGRAPHAQSRFGATDDDERAVERALADADATELVGRRIEELSGGERQRVLVAMALAQEPRILLLDEPTQHLDLAHQVALLAALDRLRRTRGVAVVAVLHDPALTALASARVVLLAEGRIVADGPAVEVLDPARIAAVFGVPLPTALALTRVNRGGSR